MHDYDRIWMFPAFFWALIIAMMLFHCQDCMPWQPDWNGWK